MKERLVAIDLDDPQIKRLLLEKVTAEIEVGKLQRRIATQRRRITRLIEIARAARKAA